MKDHKSSIDKWRDEVKLAEKYKEKYGKSKRWDTWTDMYRNDWDNKILPVNQIFSTGRTLIPRIYFRNPRIVVTPTRPDMWVQSRIVEAVDNWLLSRIGMKKQMKRIVLDAYLYGTGIGKSGYDSEYGYSQEDSRESTEYEQELLDRGYPLREEERIEYDTNILPGMPWYKRVNPRDIFVPWGILELQESPWIVHRFTRHIDDVKADPKYSNTGDLAATHRSMALEDKNIRQSALNSRHEDSYVELYEVYDLKAGKVRVYATGHKMWLREDDLILDQLPFDSLVWNENPEAFWGVSDTSMLEPQQKELNEIRTQYREHRKYSILKLLVQKDSLSPEAKQALTSGEPGALVEVEAEIDSSIKELKPYLTNDLLMAAQEVRRDIRETVGFSRNSMGEYDTSSRRTAYEASVVNQAMQIRVDERRDVVADLLVQAVRRFNQYIFEFWKEPKVSRIVGIEKAANWIKFTGDEIRGEYNLIIDPDTAKAVSSERRKQEALEYGNWAANMYQLNPQGFNLTEIFKYVTQQFDGVPEKVLNMQQTPEGVIPMDIQTAQQQMMSQGSAPQMPGQAPQQGGGQGNADIQALLQAMQQGV